MSNFLFKNIANIISILGVLPLALLYLNNGYQYLLPLILFNNIMDDLDGILAAKLNIRSRFGANLDNVCDAVAHVAITLALGVHFSGGVLLVSIITSGAIILRATSRLSVDASSIGSPTNELMRHLFFVLVLSNIFDFNPEYALILVGNSTPWLTERHGYDPTCYGKKNDDYDSRPSDHPIFSIFG